MFTLILASLLSLPLYPLNPEAQDTLASANLHFTIGVNGPNSIVSTGPEMSLKYEMLVQHPIVIRAAVDYKYGDVTTRLFPNGYIHTAVTSVEVFFYRGTDKLTGYLGAGIVYSYNYFKLTSAAADSLVTNHAINDVRIKNTFGYRITLGMRIHRSYAIEFAVTEVRPDFIYTARTSPSQYSEIAERTRLNDVRLTFGFLLPVRIF